MKPLFIASIIIVSGALAGCAGMSNADKGTAIGAVGGAVAGSALTGGSTLGTVGGAVAGGVIGHEVGENRDERRGRGN